MLRMRTAGILVSILASGGFGCNNKQTDTSDEAVNQVPIANAGSDISQPADQEVDLDGHGSYDPDGDTLTYHWAFEHVPEGSEITAREAPFTLNDDANAAGTSFTPDLVGTYVVALTVKDAEYESAPDYVVVTTTDPETVPVADAGDDQSTTLGEPVTLDGSESYDPQGRTLEYAWSLVDLPDDSALSATSISGASSAEATFSPDVKGVYIANLVVNNGLVDSDPDAAMVTVTADNGEPTANAGEDIEGEDCSDIELDCSASVDPDGDELTYQWELQTKPDESDATNDDFTDRNEATTTFFPDEAGGYSFSCTVSDGEVWSTPDMVTAVIAEREDNEDPVVDAGSSINESAGTVTCVEDGYTFDCETCPDVETTLGENASVTDADDDPLTYEWEVLSGTATIDDPTSLETTVTLSEPTASEPGECDDTEYEFQLTVVDCTGAEVTDTVTYTATCCGEEETEEKSAAPPAARTAPSRSAPPKAKAPRPRTSGGSGATP